MTTTTRKIDRIFRDLAELLQPDGWERHKRRRTLVRTGRFGVHVLNFQVSRSSFPGHPSFFINLCVEYPAPGADINPGPGRWTRLTTTPERFGNQRWAVDEIDASLIAEALEASAPFFAEFDNEAEFDRITLFRSTLPGSQPPA